MNPAIALVNADATPLEVIEYPSVRLAFMDNEHRGLAILHSELSQAISVDKPSIASVDALIEQLLAHFSQHFAHEERAMKAVDYPYTALHRQQHRRALENIALYVGCWKRQRNVWALRDFVDGAFAKWFSHHVRSADTAAALFIAHYKDKEAA